MFLVIIIIGQYLFVIYNFIEKTDLKRVNKGITFNEEKNQKEEYDNELWKATFDFNSQNVEYSDEILNSQPKLRRSQRIRNLIPKYFNSDYVQ